MRISDASADVGGSEVDSGGVKESTSGFPFSLNGVVVVGAALMTELMSSGTSDGLT